MSSLRIIAFVTLAAGLLAPCDGFAQTLSCDAETEKILELEKLVETTAEAATANATISELENKIYGLENKLYGGDGSKCAAVVEEFMAADKANEYDYFDYDEDAIAVAAWKAACSASSEGYSEAECNAGEGGMADDWEAANDGSLTDAAENSKNAHNAAATAAEALAKAKYEAAEAPVHALDCETYKQGKVDEAQNRVDEADYKKNVKEAEAFFKEAVKKADACAAAEKKACDYDFSEEWDACNPDDLKHDVYVDQCQADLMEAKVGAKVGAKVEAKVEAQVEAKAEATKATKATKAAAKILELENKLFGLENPRVACPAMMVDYEAANKANSQGRKNIDEDAIAGAAWKAACSASSEGYSEDECNAGEGGMADDWKAASDGSLTDAAENSKNAHNAAADAAEHLATMEFEAAEYFKNQLGCDEYAEELKDAKSKEVKDKADEADNKKTVKEAEAFFKAAAKKAKACTAAEKKACDYDFTVEWDACNPDNLNSDVNVDQCQADLVKNA